MAHDVTLLPGEAGGNPRILDATLELIAATGVEIAWDVHPTRDHELTDAFLASARRTGLVLLPFLRGKRDVGLPAPIVQIRRALGCYANVRPVHALPGLNERFPELDVIVVRETSEDIYTGFEHESVKGMFEGLKVTTEAACERIARYAFELARAQGRRKVTTVHKSNIMKKSDGLFLRTAQRVATEYPDIEHDERIVDALCMQLVMYPERFDILLCANLFGDIVADLAAGIGGGRGNCPSMNHSSEGVRIFSVGHGDDLDVENSERANPMSLLFSSVLMLRELGEADAADRLMAAVTGALEAGVRPVLSGGSADLATFSAAVRERL